jgi:DNA invertase Pin-like site-specific DNA recombinase
LTRTSEITVEATLTYDNSGHYWVPDRESDEYRTALTCIRLREDGHSWREIARETNVNKDTARRIYTRREQYQPSDSTERVDAALETVR